MAASSSFYSNGKLLLTGEYVVLDGAEALAVPTTYGQHTAIKTTSSNTLLWASFDWDNSQWFSCELDATFTVLQTSSTAVSERLIQILKACQQLNPEFSFINTSVTTTLSFNRKWGLGTSSTLIANISKWASVNPYQLLELTFGGSGYDIACATNNTPILFKKQENSNTATPINFDPDFKAHIYFVYLNQKQNSREGIATYKANKSEFKTELQDISAITLAVSKTKTLEDFNYLLDVHETIISKIIKEDTVKNRLFKDFNGSVKSLGAWGGDFILATSKECPKSYFIKKGFKTVISYNNMILNPSTTMNSSHS